MTSAERRAAVLLAILGRDTAETLVNRLAPSVQQRVRDQLKQLGQRPLASHEVNATLDELDTMMRSSAPRRSRPNLAIHRGDGEPEDDEHNDLDELAIAHKPAAPAFRRTQDPLFDLARLEPYQVAGALWSESRRTAALVLNCLDPDRAAAAIQFLPAEVRNDVFLLLKQQPVIPRPLLERVVDTVVQRGCQLDREAIADDDSKTDRRLAEILRSLDRKQRAEVLQSLEATDSESCERIRRLLFRFEDLARLTDRSMQKLLTEVDTKTLAPALKGAPDEITKKVMTNLSKRAREALGEELEFLATIDPDIQQQCRRQLCEVLVKLDEAGDLTLET